MTPEERRRLGLMLMPAPAGTEAADKAALGGFLKSRGLGNEEADWDWLNRQLENPGFQPTAPDGWEPGLIHGLFPGTFGDDQTRFDYSHDEDGSRKPWPGRYADFLERMGSTGVEMLAGMPSAIWEAVTAPGESLSGELQVTDPETGMMTDEAIQRAFDLAGSVTLGAGAIPGGGLRMGLKYKGLPIDETRGKSINGPAVQYEGDTYLGGTYHSGAMTDILKEFPEAELKWENDPDSFDWGWVTEGQFEPRVRNNSRIHNPWDVLTPEEKLQLADRDLLRQTEYNKLVEEGVPPIEAMDQASRLYANKSKSAGAVPLIASRPEPSPGLPMDEASRLARADEMFPESGFHGTDTDIQSFTGSPTWITHDPSIADYYAERSAARTNLNNLSETEDAWDFSDIDSIDDLDPYLIGETIEGAINENQNIMPLRYNPGKQLDLSELGLAPDVETELWPYLVDQKIVKNDVEDFDEMLLEAGIDPSDGSSLWRSLEELGLMQDIRKAGYDSVRIDDIVAANTRRGAGTYRPSHNLEHQSVAVFDPKNIRSRWANFDPARKDETGLLFANKSKSAGALPLVTSGEPPPFYSALEKHLAQSTTRSATPEQWRATIRNAPGVKQEEVDWVGLNRFLMDAKGPVTRDQLLEQVRRGTPQIEMKVKGAQYFKEEETRARYEEETGEDWDDLSESDQQGWLDWDDNEPFDATKFSSYQLPGGENYREMLLTMPRRPATSAEIDAAMKNGWPFSDQMYTMQSGDLSTQPEFRSPHWDEPNVLAHARVNDRSLPVPDHVELAKKLDQTKPGWEKSLQKKTLFIEEIQSDWHQKGRREGYASAATPEMLATAQGDVTRASDALRDYLSSRSRDFGPQDIDQAIADVRSERIPSFMLGSSQEHLATDFIDALRVRQELSGSGRVPDAPFKKSWPDQVLRRLVDDAVRNGYDQIAWTDGATQAARYDLSKQIDSVTAMRKTEGGWSLRMVPKGGSSYPVDVPAGKLADYVGKELAEKIEKQEGKSSPSGVGRVYEGLDLQVGGEGMKAFYDKELVTRANKLYGKYGAKVTQSRLGQAKLKGVSPEEYQNARAEMRQRGITPPNHEYVERWVRESRDENTDLHDRPQIHILPITPEMRAAVLGEGQPLFANKSKAAGAGVLAGGERDAYISKFIGEDPYDNSLTVNPNLREGRPLSESAQQMTTALDEAFQSAPRAQEDLWVYRGTSKIGGPDPAFLSTTRSKSVAEEFADNEDGQVYKIRVPKGTPFLDTSSYQMSGMKYQEEMMLPRGGTLSPNPDGSYTFVWKKLADDDERRRTARALKGN